MLLGIKQAKAYLTQAQKDRIRDIERNEMNYHEDEGDESEEAEQVEIIQEPVEEIVKEEKMDDIENQD